MKKFISVILSVGVFFSILLMGGCSDFAFNPLGKWLLTNSLYDDSTNQQMNYDIEYIFEKSGTGYAVADGNRTNITFTYEYDDDYVYITVKNPTGEIAETQKYTVSDDGSKLVNTTTYEYTDENGNPYTYDMVITLTKE